MKNFDEISGQVGYKVLECSNDDIIPVSDIDSDSQKIIIFDDYVCEKTRKRLSIILLEDVIRTVQ